MANRAYSTSDRSNSYTEFYAGVGHKWVSSRLYLSPHYFEAGVWTLYGEVNGNFSPARKWTVDGHVGMLVPLRTPADVQGFGTEYDSAEWKRCTSVADCADPKPNAWQVDDVQTLVSKTFADRAGPAMDYLNKRAWTNDTVNKLIAWMTDNQATGEDGAKHFLKENEALWTGWVSPDVAQKVKAAL